MDVLVGVVLATVGVALIGLSGALAGKVGASNAAFLGKSTQSAGWRSWNRFIFILVGSIFVVGGLLLALDVLDLRN